jgi:tetratricopeptide (TPR) repeat protein
MSLMNDALRKKRGEEKHLSKADFFQGGGKRKIHRGFKIAGIAALAIFLIAVAGYTVWQYISISTPVITPAGMPRSAAENPAAKDDPDSGEYEQDPSASFNVTADIIPQHEGPPVISAVILEAEKQKESSDSVEPHVPKTVLPEIPARQNGIVSSKEKKTSVASQEAALYGSDLQQRKADILESNQFETSKTDGMPSSPNLNPAEALFYQKAVSYHRSNHLEKAIQMYEMVLRQKPTHRPTLFNLASAYIKISAYSKAHSILETMNEQDPDNPEILLNLAIAKIGLGKTDNVMGLLERAEDLFQTPTFELFFHKGVIFSRNGDYKKAVEWYAKSEKLQPENPYMLCNTAIAYDHLQQYDDALNYYRALLSTVNSFSRTEKQQIEKRTRELARYLAENPAYEQNLKESKGSAE